MTSFVASRLAPLLDLARRALAALRTALGRPAPAASDGDREAEAELLTRLHGPGPERRTAFQEVVRLHQAWLTSFLTALLANAHDAQDVAQEVFLRAYLAIDRFRGDSRLRTWLTRIALNQAHNHRRGQRDYTTGAELRPVPDRQGATVVERDAVLKTLSGLGHDQREVLVLRYFEELDVCEVADALEIGESAAKMRLQRARREFGERYAALTGGGPT